MTEAFTVNCISCIPPDNEEEKARTFYEDEWCHAVLRVDNQCWLCRFVIVPNEHLEPLEFWISPISTECMKAYVKCANAITAAFPATYVQMLQLGSLTVDEHNKPTTDQRYRHAHIHGIPRYEIPPLFNGKSWPDPQFVEGKFTALNLDPQCGLPKIIPTRDEIKLLVGILRDSFPDIPKQSQLYNQQSLPHHKSLWLTLEDYLQLKTPTRNLCAYMLARGENKGLVCCSIATNAVIPENYLSYRCDSCSNKLGIIHKRITSMDCNMYEKSVYACSYVSKLPISTTSLWLTLDEYKSLVIKGYKLCAYMTNTDDEIKGMVCCNRAVNTTSEISKYRCNECKNKTGIMHLHL